MTKPWTDERRRRAMVGNVVHEHINTELAYRDFIKGLVYPAEALEVFLTHARSLRDFYVRDSGSHEDDTFAIQFLGDKAKDWERVRAALSNAELERAKGPIDKLLMHLSWDRVDPEKQLTTWDWQASVRMMYRELKAYWNAFLTTLPDPDGPWFLEEWGRRKKKFDL